MRILCGLDTEFGLLIEGRSADTQIEDSTALVRAYPNESFIGWDYRYESPRADLRGFTLSRLAQDPEDARFDAGKTYGDPHAVRADRILPNGGRLYNDHGHPEYATPESWSIFEVALHDAAGTQAVLDAARALESEIDASVSIYKNNTDFHGASWGTHESYLVPRELGFDRLFADLLPMLVVRQVLVGAGKVGSEHGKASFFQLSQRADFFVEPANAETLFRRPIFNTRDEPHSSAEKFIRLHVITGDSNMIASSTALKLGLVKLALHLSVNGTAPLWKFRNPVEAIQEISKDDTYQFKIELQNESWTNAYQIFESYFAAAEATLELDDEERWTIERGRFLLHALQSDWNSFRQYVDWAAKRSMLESFMAEQGMDWRDPSLRAYDMEYHNANPEMSLHAALVEMGEVEPDLDPAAVELHLKTQQEETRAKVRSIAVRKYRDQLVTACWRTITLQSQGKNIEIDLRPDKEFPAELENTESVESFIEMVRSIE